MTNIKDFQIRSAVEWLRKAEEKQKGLRTYFKPAVFTPRHCKDIIDSVNDADLRRAGVDVEEARRLVAEVTLD